MVRDCLARESIRLNDRATIESSPSLLLEVPFLLELFADGLIRDATFLASEVKSLFIFVKLFLTIPTGCSMHRSAAHPGVDRDTSARPPSIAHTKSGLKGVLNTADRNPGTNLVGGLTFLLLEISEFNPPSSISIGN
jgi:hypothetical protein